MLSKLVTSGVLQLGLLLPAVSLLWADADPEVKSTPNPPYFLMAMMLEFHFVVAIHDSFIWFEYYLPLLDGLGFDLIIQWWSFLQSFMLSIMMCFFFIELCIPDAFLDFHMVCFCIFMIWSMMLSWAHGGMYLNATLFYLLTESLYNHVEARQGMMIWVCVTLLYACRWIPLWAVRWCVGKQLPWL
jgi:hypothetical protein